MNKDSVNSNFNSIEMSSLYVLELVDKIVNDCCEALDKYVKYVSGVLKDVSETSHALTDEELDDIILTLPTLLYFVGETQEKIGLKGDMSESTRKKIFNDYFMETEGTVQHKKSKAENETLDNEIVSFVYNRAYNLIKQRVSNALELLQSAKKVSSRRMIQLELSRSTPIYDKG